jgi:predicted TIM-barrel fold metal-dependent hydrolase
MVEKEEQNYINQDDPDAFTGRNIDWSACEPTGAAVTRPPVNIPLFDHPVINVHAHLINFRFIPDSFDFKVLMDTLRHCKVKITEDTIRILKLPVAVFGSFAGMNWLYEFIELLAQDDIAQQASQYRREMDEARVSCSTILMMDLEQACDKEGEVAFEDQVMYIHQAVNLPENRDRMLPFIMFDPRRRLSDTWHSKISHRPLETFVDFCKYAVEDLGFAGIKMYPPLGYHPSSKDGQFNTDEVNKALKALYDWCQTDRVPITAHCSLGGAYSSKVIDQHREKELGRPDNWMDVLEKYPKLILNLAHYGGNWQTDPEKEDIAARWRETIKGMIKSNNNVFADVSCNETALSADMSEAYFNALKKDLRTDKLRDRLLFGTDWPMFYHSWNEPQFTEPFANKLSRDEFKRLACDNPRLFLGDRLPAKWR